MCGGKGSRLDADVEKPLFEVGGRPMVDRVASALADSAVAETYAVTSPHAPETRDHLDERLPLVETAGDGYVTDLGAALADDRVSTPALTVAADLPLLAGDAVDVVLDARQPGASLTVAVPVALKRLLGASVDADGDPAPTGVNVVADADEETTYVTYDARFAVNVNRQSDAEVAAALLRDGPTDGLQPGGERGP
jgi:adenosylcobinamide-phosphate guanylyltransferase